MAAKTRKKENSPVSPAEIAKMLNSSLKTQVFFADPTKLLSNVDRWLPTGCQLVDLASGQNHMGFDRGGIPLGRVVELYGPPDVGKSSMAILVARTANVNGWIVIYIDAEHALDRHRCNLMGLNLKDIIHMQPAYIEQAFEYVTGALVKIRERKINTPVIFLWDTLARTKTREQYEGKDKLGSRARAVRSGIVNHLGDSLPLHKASLLILNHMVTGNITSGGGLKDSPGGTALRHEASLRWYMTFLSGGRIKKSEKVIGTRAKLIVQESNICIPKREVGISVFFDRGVDNDDSNLLFLSASKVINENAGWYTWELEGKEHKFRRWDFGTYIRENKLQEIVRDEVNKSFMDIYPN